MHSLLTDMLMLLKKIEALLGAQDKARAELDALWVTFGATVRQQREDRRMTLIELGKRMGVSKSALSFMENGERSWSLPLAVKAVEALMK